MSTRKPTIERAPNGQLNISGRDSAKPTVTSRPPTGDSPRAMDMSKVTTPIPLHLLRAEISFPLLFLLKCRVTLGGFKKTISPQFPREMIELAALPLWVYQNLKRKVGEKKVFEIMRVAILTRGIAQWNLAYRATVEKRTSENLCDAEIAVNRTRPTRWNTMEIVERTARRFEIRITRCMYHELTTSLGIPELTPVVRQIDNAAFNSYLPDKVLFSRGGPGHRIADGKKECNFVWDLHE